VAELRDGWGAGGAIERRGGFGGCDYAGSDESIGTTPLTGICDEEVMLILKGGKIKKSL
jgi:hypothetical protein